LKLTRNRVEKYKDVDRDENRHTFLKLPSLRARAGCGATSGMFRVTYDIYVWRGMAGQVCMTYEWC